MKKLITLLASLALVASGLHVLPALAAEEVTVPDVVNIEDPYGDGNSLGDDQVTPADGSTVADIGKVWFSHDATNLNVHFLTEGPPGANTVGIQLIAAVGPEGCGEFSGIYKGLTYLSDNYGRLIDSCNGIEEPILGTFTFGEGPEGTGLATLSIPRGGSPLLADGSTLDAPTAESWIFAGGEQLTPSGYRGVRQMVDDTQPGTAYAVTGATNTPPGKNPIPGKKKGCTKGKGKKRGCEGPGKKSPKPGKPSAACAPLTPAAAGAEAPSVTLTDAATADKPLVQPLTLEQRFDEGIPAAIGAPGSSEAAPASVNVLVDTASKGPIGLYATLEFPERRDYDLFAYWPGTENEEAASSHGFQPLIETQGAPGPADQSNTGTNYGGESHVDSENLVGILTPDCGGYTISAYTYLGEGGDMELKLWLGEAKYNPADTPAPAAAMRSAYNGVLTLL